MLWTMLIRDASAALDAEACAAIYAPYVIGTAITFETDPPSPAEMAARIKTAQQNHAWLVLQTRCDLRDGIRVAVSLVAPILMVVLANLLLKEKSGAGTYVAIALAIVGVVLILQPYGTRFDGYALVALSSALFFALAAVATRWLGHSDAPIVTSIWGNTTILLASAAVLFVTGWTWPQPGDWLLFLGVGIAGGIGNVLYILGLRISRVAEVAVLDYSLFAWAALLGLAIFDELVSLMVGLGAALIVASGVYNVLGRRWSFGRRPRSPGITPLV